MPPVRSGPPGTRLSTPGEDLTDLPIDGWWAPGPAGVQRLLELGVLANAIAVAADRDQMTVMHEAIDERRRPDFVAEDLALFFEALVRRQDRPGAFVATRHQLEEEHGAGASDREVADLVDDEQGRMREESEATLAAPGGLSFLQRRDWVSERAVVHASTTLRGGDRVA